MTHNKPENVKTQNSLSDEINQVVTLLNSKHSGAKQNDIATKFFLMSNFIHNKSRCHSIDNSPFADNPWHTVYAWIATLSYYGLPDIMESQLETAYKEVTQSYNKCKIRKCLKRRLTLKNPLVKTSWTLSGYVIAYEKITVLLNSEYLDAMKQPCNKLYGDIIFKLIYNENIPENPDLESIFRKWQIVIEKFLTQICQVLVE